MSERYWELEFNLDDDRAAHPDDVIRAPHAESVMHERRGTFDERHQWWIDSNQCPLAGCHRDLDDEGCCPGCGWSILEERIRERTPEDSADYVRTLPLALFEEEYAPAQITESEAA